MRRIAFTLACVCAASQPAAGANNHHNIWNFTGGVDGNSPRGDLLVDKAGVIYGTTSTGGVSGNGVVFRLVPPVAGTGEGVITTLFSFTGAADGSLPTGGLIADGLGALYGTTALDGDGNGGTVFRLRPPAAGRVEWTQTTLWSFGPGRGGSNPVGSLVFDAAGALYGTTEHGGKHGFGTVFRLSPPLVRSGPWTETTVWNFTGGADGANPVAAVVLGPNGAIFGTAKAGGPGGAGAVFALYPKTDGKWRHDTIWGFRGGAGGSTPTGTLLGDGVGGFYGTASFGGGTNANCDQSRFPYYGEPVSETTPAENAAYVPPGGNACGVVFHLTPPAPGHSGWDEAAIWRFAGGLDGANPASGLTFGPSNLLYAVATEYGEAFWGTEISLAAPTVEGADWTLVPVATFNGKDEGFYPRGSLSFGALGRLYGTTSVGGTTWEHVSNYGYGTIFNSDP